MRADRERFGQGGVLKLEPIGDFQRMMRRHPQILGVCSRHRGGEADDAVAWTEDAEAVAAALTGWPALVTLLQRQADHAVSRFEVVGGKELYVDHRRMLRVQGPCRFPTMLVCRLPVACRSEPQMPQKATLHHDVAGHARPGVLAIPRQSRESLSRD